MRYIFYDFETSDLNKLGQILNFSFIATDDNFQVIDELSEKIRIEKTILPRAQAILANRVDVIDHQSSATLSEADAVSQIQAFLQKHIKDVGDYQVCLIGYNSARFDLKYLHTTFIRNAVNPYGKYVSHDVFFAAQKLYHSDKAFRSKLEKFAKKEGHSLSLSLQAIAKAYKLISKDQDHESRSDVLLTISVASLLAELGCDVREFQPFEPGRQLREGMVLWKISSWPNRDSDAKPYLLLANHRRNSLWADLDHAVELFQSGEELKPAIRYIKNTELFLVGEDGATDSYEDLIDELMRKYEGISLSDFFDETTCDIEEHIYRVSPGDITKLRPVFEKKESSKGLPADYRSLFVRYRLRSYEWGGKHDAQVRNQLKAFAEKRYGGECELGSGEALPSFEQLRKEVVSAEKKASSSDDKKLMSSLLQFYDDSDIAEALNH